MASGFRRDAALLVALGAVAAAVIVWLVVRSPKSAGSAIASVPADSFLVATADVWALAESPLGGAAFGDAGSRATTLLGLGAVESTCGWNPLRHVRTLALAVPEKGERGDFGLIATGDMTKDELQKCASAMISGRGGKPDVRTSGTFTIVSDASSTHGGSLAFRDGGPYLVGRGAWLDHMIDVAEGRAPSIASSPEHEAVRNDLKTRDLDAEAIVVTAVLPSALRDRLKEEMSLEAPDAGGPLAGTMNGVLAVSSAGLALHAGRGPSDDTRVVAEVRCDDDTACAQVETLILHQRLKWSGDLALRLGGLGPLIDGLETERPKPGILVLRSKVPTADVASMIERFASRPPRPTAPPMPMPRPDATISAPSEPRDAG